MTYQQLKTLIESKGYVFFDNGEFNLNFIWCRTNDKITNYFTDVLYIAYRENGVEKVFTCPSTTKAGIKGAIDSPITYQGITGTAIIIPNQYRGTWKFIDSYSGFSTCPYFAQIKGINYWRDGDKDLVIDEVQEQDNKTFGTHWHRMSNKGCKGFPINNWSLGCMGTEYPYWEQVIEITRKAVKIWGDIFTGTIIEYTEKLNVDALGEIK
jgi:hypothetical protein